MGTGAPESAALSPSRGAPQVRVGMRPREVLLNPVNLIPLPVLGVLALARMHHFVSDKFSLVAGSFGDNRHPELRRDGWMAVDPELISLCRFEMAPSRQICRLLTSNWTWLRSPTSASPTTPTRSGRR